MKVACWAVAAAAAAALAAAAGCARPRYLDAEVPAPCTARDVEGCLGWMMERDLAAVELGLYEDARLRGYVQGVVDRLARASRLPRPPRVLIGDASETYATAGRRIVVGRTVIERLGSEAELAGILAHELAHIEARHVMVSLFGRPPAAEDDPLADRRDAEAVADERAIWLLERAGYAPAAMGRALAAVLEADDPEHPPRAERIARTEALAGGRGGFEGRAELLRQLDGMVLGRDPRLGRRVGDAWVVPALGVALDLGEDDEVRAAGEHLALRRGGAAIVAYAIGAPWARELAATLEDRELADLDLGRATAGTVPAADVRPPDDSPLGKLARAIRATRPQPPAGARVAILERPGGALVIELASSPGGGLPRLPLREPTATELLAARPRRIAIERAPRAGTLAELGACPGRLLDDPARRVAAGEPIKCADGPARRAPLLALE